MSEALGCFQVGNVLFCLFIQFIQSKSSERRTFKCCFRVYSREHTLCFVQNMGVILNFFKESLLMLTQQL